jgi:hypothetical protein
VKPAFPEPIRNATLHEALTHPQAYVNNADLNYYAILGVFGQFCLKIKPMREISAIINSNVSVNQK